MKHRKFTLDTFLELSQPTTRVPLHLSPDGNLLLISVQPHKREKPDGDRSYTAHGIPQEMVGSRVLIVDTITGEVSQPFPDGSTSWGAQWSPDGMKLAAYIQYEGQACLAIWQRADKSYQLYPHVLVRPFFGFEVPQWTPDSQSVVVKLIADCDNDKTNKSTEVTSGEPVTVFSFIPGVEQTNTALPGWANGYICNLACIDIVNGAVQKLAKDWRIIGWKMAPDGHAVAVLRYTEAATKLQQFYFDLVLLSLDGSSSRTLARHIPQGYGIVFNWSPDSRSLAYIAQERGVRDQLFVVAADGSQEPRSLSQATEDLTLLRGDEIAPRWSADGHSIYCLTRQGCYEFAIDGTSQRHIKISPAHNLLSWIQSPVSRELWTPIPEKLLFLARNPETKETELIQVDMQDGTGTTVAQFPVHTGWLPFEMETANDQSTFYLLFDSSNHPTELWQFRHDYQSPKRLFKLNTHLEETNMGTCRLLTYRTLDGEQRQATLLLPPEYTEGSIVPIIVEIYGGRNGSNSLHRFGLSQDILNGQILANHGYGVLYPDLPMHDHDPLRQLPGLVLPAITHLIEQGITQPGRLGLMGHSYGGYCTLALLTQTNLFSAAVASASFSDLVSTYVTMRENGSDQWLGWCETGQGRMGGSLWEKRTAYIENSPIFYLDRVQTPLLLTCGSEDGVPPAQAEGVFVGLRRLGKRVELRRYTGEGHWPGIWSERSYRDLCERILNWFDEHLK